MHREADIIEQQAKQGKQDHNPPSGINKRFECFSLNFID